MPRAVEIFQQLPDGVGGTCLLKGMVVAGSAELEARMVLPSRGEYRLQPAEATISDLAGMTTHRVRFGGEERIDVAARVQRVDIDAIQPFHPKAMAGSMISRHRGAGGEFYSLRRYEEGESMRRINWRASAKSEDLWVNEFLAESSGTQIMVIDARLVENDPVLTREMSDVIIRTASSMAYSSLNDRNAVGLFVLGDRPRVLKPDFGFRQFLKISEMLKSTGNPSHHMAASLNRMADVYGDRKAQYVVISPLADDETLDSVAELALSKEDVIVLVPLMNAPSQLPDALQMAMTLLRLRQETNAIILAQHCRTVTWKGAGEFSAAVRRARLVQLRRRT